MAKKITAKMIADFREAGRQWIGDETYGKVEKIKELVQQGKKRHEIVQELKLYGVQVADSAAYDMAQAYIDSEGWKTLNKDAAADYIYDGMRAAMKEIGL